MEEEKSEKQTKFESWLKDKYNLGLVGVLALGIILRLYYFIITKSQAHWWDTLAYGGLAKDMILHRWVDSAFLAHEAIIRPPLLPLLWSFLLRLNIPDAGTIFLLEIIPSALSVFFIFLIAKEMYNKRVALISAFIFSVLWIHLFYSVRIMSDVPSLFFCVASFYFFVKSYDSFKLKYFALSIALISLAIITRYNFGIIGGVYLLLVIIRHKHKFLKEKNFWIGGLLGAIPLIVFFIANIFAYGGLMPAAGIYSTSANNQLSLAFYTPNYIVYILSPAMNGQSYLNFSPFSLNPFSLEILNSLMIFFIIGFIICIVELGLGYDLINKNQKIKSHLINLLVLVISLIFFIFIIKAAEDRYLFLCLIPIIILASLGLDWAYKLIKKYNKVFGIIVLVLILSLSLYYQLNFANTLINNKKSSYAEMKEAFIWLKDNTPENSVILGDGTDPYAIYYSERKVENWNYSNMLNSFEKSDYVVLHGFEHQTPQAIDFINNHSTMVAPVKQVFFPNNQPAVVVYKIIK